MSTTAGTICDAAIASSLLFDDAATDLASDTLELLAVLNRILTSVYTLAGRPPALGGGAHGDRLGISASVVLVAGEKALPTTPPIASIYLITTAAGVEVAQVPRIDLVRGIAELPPAVVIEGVTIKTAGRTGDPGATDTLTVYYTPIPGPLSLTAHFIGATTPATATTSLWPDIGNPYLIAKLVEYLLAKSEEADQPMVERNRAEIAQAAADLGAYLGLDGGKLVAITAG